MYIFMISFKIKELQQFLKILRASHGKRKRQKYQLIEEKLQSDEKTYYLSNDIRQDSV